MYHQPNTMNIVLIIVGHIIFLVTSFILMRVTMGHMVYHECRLIWTGTSMIYYLVITLTKDFSHLS